MEFGFLFLYPVKYRRYILRHIELQSILLELTAAKFFFLFTVFVVINFAYFKLMTWFHVYELKLYFILPCLTLNKLRYASRVKWSNPAEGVAPSLTPRCIEKGAFRSLSTMVTNFTLCSNLVFLHTDTHTHTYIYIYIYIYMSRAGSTWQGPIYGSNRTVWGLNWEISNDIVNWIVWKRTVWSFNYMQTNDCCFYIVSYT